MVHARLGVAAENSGKLVSLVRKRAKELAVERSADLLLVDGPPGIGCPVIASITGADLLAVTEPTPSGKHDLGRVLELARHFRVPSSVCVNKWDINPHVTGEIEVEARRLGATVLGRIPYDREVTTAQINGRSVVEYGNGPAAGEIRRIWDQLHPKML